MQPKTRAVIALDALGLAVLAALFVLWCVRTPNLTAAGGIAAGCSAALFAAVGLRFVPAWVRFWQREDAAPAVPVQEPEHMAARIFAALLALDLALLVLTWGVRALAGQPETLTQALEFWRCLDSRHYLDIARDGYIAAGERDRVVQLVFLPGYPLVVRTVMLLVPSDICAGLLTSALCFAGAGCVVYRLLRLDLPHRGAVRALRFLVLAPGCCSCRLASRCIAASTGAYRETPFNFSSTSASTGTSARDYFSTPPHIRRTTCCAACAAATGATRSVSGCRTSSRAFPPSFCWQRPRRGCAQARRRGFSRITSSPSARHGC